MKPATPVAAVLLTLMALASCFVRADSWLVAVLSGNARADAWLISLSSEGDPRPLLHEVADIKTDAEFLGYTGNIASRHSRQVELFAGLLTGQLLAKLLPQVSRLREKGVLGESPEFSFLYAIAGLDAVDGLVEGYNPQNGRQVVNAYEDIVDEQFRSHGLSLGALVPAHDGALLLEAVKGQSPSPQLVIYDDTYGVGYLLRNGEVIKQDSAFAGRVPAGGFYQLGREGQDLLDSNNETSERLLRHIQSYWKKQNLDYSPDYVKERYAGKNRNELGGVISRLISEGETFLQPEFINTVDGLVNLAKSLDNTCPYAKTVPVKIIGFYGQTLQSEQSVLEGRFASLSGGKLVPELVTGEQLNNALASAAVRVFKQVMKARYGVE